MLNKKLIMLSIFIVSFLAISVVSAQDNATTDAVGIDNVNGDGIIGEAGDGLTANPKTYTDLYEKINSGESVIFLNENYIFNNSSDSYYRNGIYINHTMTIYGNGSVIDGNSAARIFMVHDNIGSVIIRDLVFVNGNSTYEGGAIKGKATVINCTFTNNHAKDGGAIYGNSTVINCTFNNNTATGKGGAIFANQNVALNNAFENNRAYQVVQSTLIVIWNIVK